MSNFIPVFRSDEGLALETSAIVSFTAFHYPHQHTVDTPVCFPPRRRSQPSSLKSWHYTVHTCLIFYDHLCDAKPSNFRIPLLSDQHSYTTRKVSSDQLYIPFFRTNIKKFCPTIIGRYFWNDLPASIRSRPTKKLFKNVVFKLYLSQY